MAEFIRGKFNKCRKQHTCWGCYKIIAPGEIAYLSVNTDEGRMYSLHTCGFCHGVIGEMNTWDLEETRQFTLPETEIYQEMYKEKYGNIKKSA